MPAGRAARCPPPLRPPLREAGAGRSRPAALPLLVAGALTWLWGLRAGRTMAFDVAPLAASGLGLMWGAGMRVAAGALEGDRKAN